MPLLRKSSFARLRIKCSVTAYFQTVLGILQSGEQASTPAELNVMFRRWAKVQRQLTASLRSKSQGFQMSGHLHALIQYTCQRPSSHQAGLRSAPLRKDGVQETIGRRRAPPGAFRIHRS